MTVVERTSPDLVVVDLGLGSSSGLELLKDLHTRWPKLHMLVVSMQDEELYAERALRAGARGYITKQQATHGILAAIRRVVAGGIYLSEHASAAVLSRLAAGPEEVGDCLVETLSDRELQIFELTGTGLNTRDIAERLHLDVKTVETYRARIKEKLKLNTASDLLQLAIRWNRDRLPR